MRFEMDLKRFTKFWVILVEVLKGKGILLIFNTAEVKLV